MFFRDIIGQESVKQRLISSVQDNRVSHAQLFLGQEGSGNLALALAYTRYVFCLSKGREDSCGTCSSCIKFNKYVHPDLHFMFPQVSKKVGKSESAQEEVKVSVLAEWRQALLEHPYLNIHLWYEKIGVENKQGFISVDDVAEMTRLLSLKPVESTYKAVIIWLPEKMRVDAANKILKILEEPPQHTLFILVAENHDLLLSTVLSRVQLVKLNGLSEEQVVNALIETKGADYHKAVGAARVADGNYGLALDLALGEEEDHSGNGKLFIEWMRFCFQLQRDTSVTRDIISWVETLAATGREQQKGFLAYSLFMIRQAFLMNFAGENLVRLEEDELVFCRKFSPFVNSNNCERFTKEINDAYFQVERNANPKILFLHLSFTISRILQIKA